MVLFRVRRETNQKLWFGALRNGTYVGQITKVQGKRESKPGKNHLLPPPLFQSNIARPRPPGHPGPSGDFEVSTISEL